MRDTTRSYNLFKLNANLNVNYFQSLFRNRQRLENAFSFNKQFEIKSERINYFSSNYTTKRQTKSNHNLFKLDTNFKSTFSKIDTILYRYHKH